MLLFALLAVALGKLVSMVYYEDSTCTGEPTRYQFLPPDTCFKNTQGGSFKVTVETKDVLFQIFSQPDTTCSSTAQKDVFQYGCNAGQKIAITVNDTVSIKKSGWMLEAIYTDATCGQSDVYAGIGQPYPNCKAAACRKEGEGQSYEMICSPFTWPKPSRRPRKALRDEVTFLR